MDRIERDIEDIISKINNKCSKCVKGHKNCCICVWKVKTK